MAAPRQRPSKKASTKKPTAPQSSSSGPVIPASVSLPEITLKGMILGLVLAVVLGAANAFAGMRVGLTVSASIPAAVISMGVLRAFRNRNILENNVVQTAASTGEALAAGVIFTIPALLLTGTWADVHLVETFIIAGLGGVLGVLFTIPLRRALVVEQNLPYPEGTACAEVLKAGEETAGTGARFLFGAMVVGALYAFLQLGMRFWGGTLEAARRVGGTVAYAGTEMAPILLGVGYIVGLRIASYIFLGGAVAWFILIPSFFFLYGWPVDGAAVELPALDAAYQMWTTKIRLVGGGAMITGGLLAIWKIRGTLGGAVREGLTAFRGAASATLPKRERTEDDLGMRFVTWGILATLVPLFFVYYSFTDSYLQAGVATLAMVIAGFFFSAVAGYLSGVVGASNNPVSGVTIVTLLFASALLILMGATGDAGIAAALGVGAVIATAGAIGSDNLQDLKTGRIVGATPKKQQIAQIAGVIAFALVAGLVLKVLHDAFTIGSEVLPAPQATLMAFILDGVFNGTLDRELLFLGALIGAGFAAARLPVLPVAVGLYLPFGLDAGIFLGGVLAFLSARSLSRAGAPPPDKERAEQQGVLFASGIIAGEAIMGVLIALTVVVAGAAAPAIAGLTSAEAQAVFVSDTMARLAPLVIGVLLAAGSIVLFADAGTRVRRLLSAVFLVAGIAGTALAFSSGWSYDYAARPPWPGFLLFVYVALLMVYMPLRGVLLGRRRGGAANPHGPESEAA